MQRLESHGGYSMKVFTCPERGWVSGKAIRLQANKYDMEQTKGKETGGTHLTYRSNYVLATRKHRLNTGEGR